MTSTELEQDEDDSPATVQSALTTAIIGVVMIVASVWLFSRFSELEAGGGTIRIHWLFAAIYKVAGKWVTCGVLAALSIPTFFGAASQLREARAAKKSGR